MDYMDFTGLVLSLLMLCRLFYSCLVHMHLTCCAAVAVISSGLFFALIFLSLLQMLLEPLGVDKHLPLPLLTTLVPLFSSMMQRVGSFFARLAFQISRHPCLLCKNLCRTKIYTLLTFARFEKVARGLTETLLPSGKTARPSICEYAEALRAHAADELCDLHRQAKLDSILKSHKKISLFDLLRVACLYIPFLCKVVWASFNRSLKLSKLKRGIRDSRKTADADEQLTWQVLLDQYEWYLRSGYCLSDILEKLVCYDEKAGRALWLFKCLDDVTAFWWSFLGQKGLWVPSPEQRKKDLDLRRRLVVTLAQGKRLQ